MNEQQNSPSINRYLSKIRVLVSKHNNHHSRPRIRTAPKYRNRMYPSHRNVATFSTAPRTAPFKFHTPSILPYVYMLMNNNTSSKHPNNILCVLNLRPPINLLKIHNNIRPTKSPQRIIPVPVDRSLGSPSEGVCYFLV